MAAPVVVSVGTVLAGSNSTTANVPVPATSVASGLLDMVFFYVEDTETVTLPGGWAEAPDSPVIVTGGFDMHVYWKRPTGSETGTYNFTIAAGLTWRTAVAIRFSGVLGSGSPFDDTNPGINTGSVTATPPISIVTTGTDRLLVWMGGSFSGSVCSTVTGFTEQADPGSFAVDTLAQAVAGNSGSITASFSAADMTGAWLGALLPTSATVSPLLQTLTDDFATADTAKWNGYSANVTSTGGVLSIIPDSTFGRAVSTVNTWNLTGSYAVVKVPVLGSAQIVSMQLTVGTDSLELFYNFGNLIARETLGGVFTDTTVTYNGTNHLWWRIRELGGLVYWDVSPDGATWTNVRFKSWAVSSIAAMTVHLIAYTTSGTTPTQFDNFNVLSNQLLQTLTDDFATQDAAKWNGYGANVTATGGVLSIVPDNTFARAVSSVNTYNLDGSYAIVKVPALGSGQIVAMQLATGSDDYQILADFGTLKFRETVAGTPSDTSVTYSATDHLYWLITASAGLVTWATSDGHTYTTQRTKTQAVSSISAMTVHLISYTTSGTTPTQFDDFNIIPTLTPPSSTIGATQFWFVSWK